MSSLFETIIRADDFLHCQFEFVNLALRTSSAGTQQLERAAAGPAFIIVRLPPQNIAEQVAQGSLTLNLPYQAGLSGPVAVDASAIRTLRAPIEIIHLVKDRRHGDLAYNPASPSVRQFHPVQGGCQSRGYSSGCTPVRQLPDKTQSR